MYIIMVLLQRISEFPDYFIDFNGNVYSKRGQLKPHLDSNVYYLVALYKDKIRYPRKVHRLVVQTFIANPYNYPAVDHIDRTKTNNNVDNLRWVTNRKNGHNRVDNNEHVNIMKRMNREGYMVQFSFRSRTRIDQTFANINDAIEFRDVIQKMIDNDEEICPMFVDLYGNDMKHIALTQYGKYQLIIKRPALKFDRSFETQAQACNRSRRFC